MGGRASQASLYFLTKLVEPFRWELKVCPNGKVNRLTGSPFFDGRVIVLAGATFPHIDTLLVQSGSLGHSEKIRVCASAIISSWHVQRGRRFPHINACYS